LLWYFSAHAADLVHSLLGKQSKWRSYVSLYLFRGVIAESEDMIKNAVDGLGKNGFINYYGLQVLYPQVQNLLPCYF
jgi:hypothetical protein